MLPKISLQLTPTFREGLSFLDNEDFSWGDTFIEVQFGYAGRSPVLSPPLSGLMLKPDIQIGADMQITLNAQGTGGFSAVRQQSGRTASEGQTRRDLISAIAGGPTGTRTLTVNFEDADRDLEVRNLLDSPAQYTQGNKTDWLALWELTNVCRAWMVLVGSELRILSRRNRMTAEPSRAFRMFDLKAGRIDSVTAIGTEVQGEFPIISFTSPTMAVFLPGSVRGSRMREISVTDRTVTTSVIDNETEQTARTGRGTQAPSERDNALPGTNAQGDGTDQLPGDPQNEEARRTAQSEWERFSNMGIEVEIESIGIPDLIPAEVVSLFGVGRRFSDQNYAITKVIHTIGSGGFTTQFTAISNIGQLVQGLPAQGPQSERLFDPRQRVSEEDIERDPLSILDDPDPLAGLL